jgi:hypothetical protein
VLDHDPVGLRDTARATKSVELSAGHGHGELQRVRDLACGERPSHSKVHHDQPGQRGARRAADALGVIHLTT